MTTEKAEQKIPGWKRLYGYWAIMPTVVINVWCGYGMYYTSFGPWVAIMGKQFGWTRAAITGANSTGNLMQIFGPLLGGFMDRVGVRKAVLVAVSAMMIGTLFVAFINKDSLWMLYVGYILLCSFGLTIPTYPGGSKTINFWFLKRRGLMIAIMTLFVGTVYFSAMFQGLFIEQYGIPGGAFYLFGLGIIMLLLAILVLRNKPSDIGVGMDGTPLPAKAATDGGQQAAPAKPKAKREKFVAKLSVKQALRTRSLWIISITSGFLVMIANTFIVGNYVAFLQGLGMSAVAAGAIWGAMGFCGWPARFIYGPLMDYFGRGCERWFLAFGCLCLAISLFGLLQVKGPQDFFWVWWWTAWYGFGWGGNMTTIFTMIGTHFGPVAYGGIYGIRSVFIGVAGFIGPLMGGWIFDVTGSYANAFWITIMLCLVSVVLAVFATAPKVTAEEMKAKIA